MQVPDQHHLGNGKKFSEHLENAQHGGEGSWDPITREWVLTDPSGRSGSLQRWNCVETCTRRGGTLVSGVMGFLCLLDTQERTANKNAVALWKQEAVKRYVSNYQARPVLGRSPSRAMRAVEDSPIRTQEAAGAQHPAPPPSSLSVFPGVGFSSSGLLNV